ncbi:NADH:ubiquinone reductase (Na(+)-transporting) subunit B [Alloalcanivorax xenomutans]|jgi:Na+-transporting NADH:ubiquinone oxidoreductase subunit B|uniref:Na(+)-translocating NADH-quinone reductase subunit B n=1 Tax=Alloalcanivorax xenomutans TaxID=1094342 RepID=A0A9Q3W5U2_9GAMM|nr:NADH:ubiquinone reductase (Na(+)-transporting) subunit B [Alloalcanivorax xenomutans]ERS14585.1 Na(+)-translocating NADH-quinone reductase subunit B [Alcanivorax sp. PN-3]KYZ88225.1 NADH:ubiquinone reductase (Na(+)-transporting) subunit B [Alcanivorax sp. KX64203]MBA4720841.1 NADH:ubiquinone reductase (Na(+)-transporting) subunit B [Alcanivorax sp.]ARB45502.1 Na(+)-translocating NADH-quinone reductase subunit B [Alloalcanivorax xenomutans]MCE7509290.1 NADH:ubiquinone reductase (Na(+)-transp
MGLRNYLDTKVAPHFHEGGKLQKYYVFYEMFDTMLYSPDSVTRSAAHVRDGIDLKRIMMTVWFATFPAILFGLYNTGFQANLQITEFGFDPIPGWRTELVAALTGFSQENFWANMVHGLVYYVPILIAVYLTGFFWEALFAWKRGHEVNEGFFVTGILFTLILPPAIPLWQVVLGVSFGVVIGKEVFGGTGKNFLNPALVGRAFLYFAYPAQMSGDAIWTAVDNFSGATPLSLAASGNLDFSAGLAQNALIGADAGQSLSWMNTFLGGIQGSIGETSLIAIGLGAVFLLFTKIASWRIMLGVLLGMAAMSTVFNLIGSDTNPMFAMPWYWHLTVGGLAFGLVFMATDPVSAAMTNTGKLIFGIVIGVMTVLIRVVNPAFPEGIMLAILFGNLCAPLIDYFVTQANVRRRLRRTGGVA